MTDWPVDAGFSASSRQPGEHLAGRLGALSGRHPGPAHDYKATDIKHGSSPDSITLRRHRMCGRAVTLTDP
jgi:hypothetical protein